jgi:hypothetical protein
VKCVTAPCRVGEDCVCCSCRGARFLTVTCPTRSILSIQDWMLEYPYLDVGVSIYSMLEYP